MMSEEFRALVGRELVNSLRNKWLISYALMYAALGLSLSYYGLMGLGYVGLRGFGRISASLINLTLYLVPLISMSLAGLSIVSEREEGTLERVLSQPVSKTELLFGKYIGIVASIGTTTGLGYGLDAWLLWLVLNPADIGAFLSIMFSSILLASALAAVGLFISIVASSRFGALAAVLMAWLGLVAIYDLLVMGVTMVADLRWNDLLPLLMLNPVESARILMIYSFDQSLLFLGPTGTYVARAFGPNVPLAFGASLASWTVIAIVAALLAFKRQDL